MQAAAATTDEDSGESSPASLASALRRKLSDAEEHQKSVAAQLHSREAQLTLARQQLSQMEGERERYVGIVSDASAKLTAAAGTPGDSTARSVARRAEATELASVAAEKKLDELLDACVRAAEEWKAAELLTAESTANPLGEVFYPVTPAAAAAAAGPTKLGNNSNAKTRQTEADGSDDENTLPLGGAAPEKVKEKGGGGRASLGSIDAASKQRRLARQAAAKEVVRTASNAKEAGGALRTKRIELVSLTSSLREMLTALELERTARIRLQELLARDWTLQAAALKRCFHEQDVVLEVALHKLEVHGGAELAEALAYQMGQLRKKMAATLEEEAVAELRSNATQEYLGLGEKKGVGGGKRASKAHALMRRIRRSRRMVVMVVA